MKNYIKTFLSIVGAGALIILGMGFVASSALAAPITPTYGGGLGTSTLPALGSIPCGVTSSQYAVLAVGSNGQVPVASSTAPCGISWANQSGGGGSGNGNVFVTPSSSVVANTFLWWNATATTTVATSSNLSETITGINVTGTKSVFQNGSSSFTFDTSTSSPNLFLNITNSSSISQFTVASTGLTSVLNLNDASITNALYYGTSTATAVPVTIGTNLSISAGVLNASGGGGTGSGNLFVTPTSSVIANNVVTFQSSASSTVKATTSLYTFNDGDIAQNTSTDNGNVNFVNASGIPTLRISTTTVATNTPSLNVLGASTTAISSFSVFQVLGDGHLDATGTIPVVSSCGTGSPTVIGSDVAGVITTASAATSCTLTFQIPYESSNVMCTATTNSTVGLADVSSISNTAVTFGIGSALTSGKIYYFCSENL